MNRIKCILLLSASLLLLGAPALAEDIEKDYHETFNVMPGHQLSLEHGDGDVTVTPWDQDVLDVQVRYRASVRKIGLGNHASFEVKFEQDGRTVRVVGDEDSGLTVGSLSWNTKEYVYTIKAPAYLVLDLEGDDGDVRIEGWHGEIACRLDDGAIEVDDSEGNFDLETEDGDIIVKNTLAGKLKVRADDGDMDLDLRRTDSLDLDAQTGDGDIALTVETGTSADFAIDSDDGDIQLDLGETQGRFDGHASGEIGGGAGRIRLRSDDGSVRLREGR